MILVYNKSNTWLGHNKKEWCDTKQKNCMRESGRYQYGESGRYQYGELQAITGQK